MTPPCGHTRYSLLTVWFPPQRDLIHTVGESAALGAAGFVIWGDLNLTSSKVRTPQRRSLIG